MLLQRRILVALSLFASLGCASVRSDAPAGTGGNGSGGGGTGGTSMAQTGGRAGAGTGGVPFDAGVIVQEDTAGCTRLNIGILGNPGSNASSNFQAWLEARGTIVQRFQTTPDVPLTAEALAPFDVVVLDLPPRQYDADEAALFAAWVNAGGGVAAMSGYHDDTSQDWRSNSLLAPLGIAYAGDRIWGPVTQFAAHPTTASLTSVTFTGGYPVAELAGATSTRTPLAFIPKDGGKVAIAYAVEAGKGKVFAWGDEWIEFDSEWSSSTQIPKLWLQVFSWIAPGSRCTLTGIG